MYEFGFVLNFLKDKLMIIKIVFIIRKLKIYFLVRKG